MSLFRSLLDVALMFVFKKWVFALLRSLLNFLARHVNFDRGRGLQHYMFPNVQVPPMPIKPCIMVPLRLLSGYGHFFLGSGGSCATVEF